MLKELTGSTIYYYCVIRVLFNLTNEFEYAVNERVE